MKKEKLTVLFCQIGTAITYLSLKWFPLPLPLSVAFTKFIIFTYKDSYINQSATFHSDRTNLNIKREKCDFSFFNISIGHKLSLSLQNLIINPFNYMAFTNNIMIVRHRLLTELVKLWKNGVQVSKLMFPLGRLMKNEVRDIALRAGLPSARRRDSQGICFLGKIDYNDFVRRFLGEREGDIVELETGRKLGKHRGYWFHTIGQRKGLGLGGGPWFVVRKDVEENVIYVSRGCDTALQYGYEFRMYDFHFITDNPWKGAQEEVEVTFKIRHTPEFVKGRLQKEAEGYRIVSEEKLQGIAPGQFGVVYDADARLCVGSGEIYI